MFISKGGTMNNYFHSVDHGHVEFTDSGANDHGKKCKPSNIKLVGTFDPHVAEGMKIKIAEDINLHS